ncbi:MAG: HAD family hydrolase [Deltaproteobacteria bacterium]|nr:HAD family hydrolase [Deltaproteobacteria bacterium]MBW2121646.1 HAD family hydrolase [Deltaproteobacteria bacterium]
MIEAIIFDFGQTLVDEAEGFRQAEKEVEKLIFSSLGLDSPEEFLKVYRDLRREFRDRYESSRVSLWQAVFEHYGKPIAMSTLREWEDAYWATVKGKARPFPEAEPVLRDLACRYRLGIVTNTQAQEGGGKHRVLEFPGLKEYFQVTIVAGESGIPAKPNPAPFVNCLKALGVDASHAVYVGDDWDIDICGARNARIEPIWIQHWSVRRSWQPGDGSVRIITSLWPLLGTGLIGASRSRGHRPWG